MQQTHGVALYSNISDFLGEKKDDNSREGHGMTQTQQPSTAEPLLVMKFGGTSVGSVEAMERAARIIETNRAEWPRIVPVLSALSGVTNLLLDTASKAARGDRKIGVEAAETLRQRHLEMGADLLRDSRRLEDFTSEVLRLCDEFSHLCGAISVLGEATNRALDAVASIGERLSVRLFAFCLEERGIAAKFVESSDLIQTDSTFQAAHPDLSATRERTRAVLLPILDEGVIPVATGFLAANAEGVTTTLGRGGSDYSAALLAAALDADEVWIWTDVDGVMTADPRIVPEARTIPTLSYRELAELAYFGAKVLHPMAIRPVIEAEIGLAIRNTFNPDHPGTRLVFQNQHSSEVIKAVTSIRGQSIITIEGRGMLGVPGVAARAFGSVAATGTNVILISQASSEQSICFAVPISKSAAVVGALERTFASEIQNRDIDRIWGSDEMVIVTVVGSGMRHTPGVAGRIFSSLGERLVNVVAIAQGSSEVAISLVVEAGAAEMAVRVLHGLIGN